MNAAYTEHCVKLVTRTLLGPQIKVSKFDDLLTIAKMYHTEFQACSNNTIGSMPPGLVPFDQLTEVRLPFAATAFV